MRHCFTPAHPNGRQPELSPSGQAAGGGGMQQTPASTQPPAILQPISRNLIAIAMLSAAVGVSAFTGAVIVAIDGSWILASAFAIGSALAGVQVRLIARQMYYDFLAAIKRADRAANDFDCVAVAYWKLLEKHNHQTGEHKRGDGVVVTFTGGPRETK